MHKMDEKEKLMCEICDLESNYINILKEITPNAAKLETKEVGELVDIVKDFSEMKYYIAKACYYEHVIKAMEEADEEEGMRYNESRMGYNNRRYSDGRYAPSGRGRVYGFEYPPDHWTEPRMDYHEKEKHDGIMGHHGRNEEWEIYSKYGKPYMEYQDARRYYTETHSEHDKKKMEEHAREHMQNSINSILEMYSKSEPHLQQKIKQDITGLLNNMNG